MVTLCFTPKFYLFPLALVCACSPSPEDAKAVGEVLRECEARPNRPPFGSLAGVEAEKECYALAANEAKRRNLRSCAVFFEAVSETGKDPLFAPTKEMKQKCDDELLDARRNF